MQCSSRRLKINDHCSVVFSSTCFVMKENKCNKNIYLLANYIDKLNIKYWRRKYCQLMIIYWKEILDGRVPKNIKEKNDFVVLCTAIKISKDGTNFINITRR